MYLYILDSVESFFRGNVFLGYRNIHSRGRVDMA
jgi:hypothetical protein